MTWLPDSAVEHLQGLWTFPDVSHTRYAVVERIAEGGMGTVYRAHDEELRRDVALKVLKGCEHEAHAVERMLREARVIARLEHPGIVPVHDVGTLPDGRIFYVMKLIRGRRLDEHFGADAARADKLRVFARVCETVAFAHAHDVIHRDLKPQNIMVGSFGEVLILDWGVAKVLSAVDHVDPANNGSREKASPQSASIPDDPDRTRTRQTVQGTVIGTPAYMAPEQARGEIDRIDARTDVYALGAILYFLLTGRSPRRAPDNELVTPRKTVASIPRRLEAICVKALAPEQSDRYEAADEVSADIARFLDGESVSAYREGVLERAARAVWKHRTILALVLAYLVMRMAYIFFRGG